MADDYSVQCAYCTGEMNRLYGPRCPQCGVFHHYNCWVEFGGCITYGCPENPDMKAFQSENKGVNNG